MTAAAFNTQNLILTLLSTHLFFLGSLITCINSPGGSWNSDRILKLPGQPPYPPISQFSGYVTVDRHHGRALFYWFFEAQSQPDHKPLLLWLNGGPGCSSIGYGAVNELGPLRVTANGAGLLYNKHAWNQEASLLFVESPVGVGFSYTNTSSDLSVLDDAFAAEDMYSFVVNWLERFPQYKSRDFYISGESYAGHYVPQLAELVYDRNRDTDNKYPHINLKGFIVGNPETNDYNDYKGLVEYAWSHTVISDEIYRRCAAVCDFTTPNWSNDCIQAMIVLFKAYREIDIYNVYAPSCLIKDNSSSSSSSYSPAEKMQTDFGSLDKVSEHASRRIRLFGGYDPCYSNHAVDYFNRADVQAAFHATRGNNDRSSVMKWKVCSGDADGRVPIIGSRYDAEALGLPVKSPWSSWYHDHQVGGRIVEYEGLTLVTVRGAGHLVPLNKPAEALAMPHHDWISGEWMIGSKDEQSLLASWLMNCQGREEETEVTKTLKTYDQSRFLREELDASYIIPVPSPSNASTILKARGGRSEGWWIGYISQILDDWNYIVYFRMTKEEMVFKHTELRPQQEWVDGQWFSATKVNLAV
ncbi:hypothetical protein MLD38_038766 [Melastoma candidum]|uniref:Uncharacterized protein n=1 Tax=Melastoma candidum TaxID=119954 RepID=A0ACB9L0S7_9MYRT|nr:hypothetical protein MLD38_038766 [Melastoma candidum]